MVPVVPAVPAVSVVPVVLAEPAHSSPTEDDYATMSQLLLDKSYSESDKNYPDGLCPDEEWIDPRKGARRSNEGQIIGITFKADTAGATLKRMAKKRSTGSNGAN